MSDIIVNSIKKDAIINVPITTVEILQYHSILLKHLDGVFELDNESWSIIETFCSKIDECARNQNLTETLKVKF